MSARAAALNRAAVLLQEAIVALSSALVDELRAPPAPYLSIEDFAAYLGVSESTVRRMVAEGMPLTRPRRRTPRVPVALAEEWILKKNQQDGASDAEQPPPVDGSSDAVR